ncbi:transcriptional regulator, LysR family protein [Roseobacter sp. SK209-2-6]|uniref:LysR family transcriptional regulator n=1 Tax=Roseobacter sp. SK209-2-6 TaxID=388739 RepID=UPI0000F3F30D|nr:LysR family transcriptional regulator [Roseobacter sp. SK209-2-6]EBA16487.1 transcriptional regulator, LysR family protein [Roseobacter sp. SK209-2-6]
MHNSKTGDSKFDSIPLEWVRAFETTARLGSFTAAARETGLTQPAISQRIANLEHQLGTKLFVRKTRAIHLTTEGEAWLPHVQAALNSLRDSSEALFGVGRNKIVISASSSIVQHWITPRLPALLEASGAEVTINTMVLSGDAAEEDGTVKIRYGAGDWPGLYKAPLFEERITPMAAPPLLQKAEDWRDLPRLSVSGPRPSWRNWREFTGQPTTSPTALRYDTFASALSAARAGLGVLLGSLPLCQADLESGALIQMSTEVMPHHESYWLLASKERISRRQWEVLRASLTK